jgi:SAM-dependent methyltransferase
MSLLEEKSRPGGVRRQVCTACGGRQLSLRFQVAGKLGEDGLIPTTDQYGVAMADILRCERCGHMQLSQMPTETDLAEAYREAESADYVQEEKGQRATASKIVERIERHQRPGKLADLGCWVGFLPSEAERRGWKAVGIEPSEFASAYARDRLGLDVRTAGLFDADDLGESRFDAVFMGDVIEHIPAADLAIDRARHLLKPNGVFALALPDAGSRVARLLGRRWWSVIPTHVHYFTRGSITTLLDRKGFEVVEITTSPKVFTVDYYLDRLSGYSAWLGRTVTRTAARVGVGRRLWGPDFRDRMLVIARRPRS